MCFSEKIYEDMHHYAYLEDWWEVWALGKLISVLMRKRDSYTLWLITFPKIYGNIYVFSHTLTLFMFGCEM